MTSFKFGKLSIDPVELGSRGNAVLGIRDSGKTYTATFLAERLFEAGIPFLAFDPIGVWRFLRVPGAGRGYPVVVAGGQEGDLPLTVASAPEIVRAAMANGVSLVIDLFDINLTKADWKRIVMACVRVLLHENAKHGLRHVFIEEAAEFAPQRVGPDQGQVYAEIEKLARMGGNARLGYTLINQRAEEVNKAVLELCDNLFLHRQKGRNSLTALSKWLDIGAVKDHKDIIDTLSTLPTGECWAWLGGTERPVHVKVPAKHSLHPDRRVMRGGIENMQAKPVDVEKFVSNMRGTLVTVEAEAKANDPALLKREIADLKRQLAAKPAAAAPTIERVEVNVVSDEQLRRIADLAQVLGETGQRITVAADHLRADLAKVVQAKAAPRSFGDKTGTYADPRGRFEPPRQPVVQKRTAPAPADSGLSRAAERKILNALALYPQGRTVRQVAILAGYAMNGGGFRNAVGKLRSLGYVESPSPAFLKINAAGAAALGEVEPLPTGPALVQHWLGQLDRKAEREILSVLVGAYPDALTADQIASRTETQYEPNGGGFRNALGKLRTLELVTGRGELRASEELFT